MDRLAAYGMFVEVAQRGGFSSAARQLGLSPQAVTRGIAALEAELGVSLLHRSTRSVTLSAQGAALLPRIQRLLADLAEAEREASGARTEPRGLLSLTAPVKFGTMHVLPVAMALLGQHPLLEIRTLLVDRNVDLIEEGVDVAVRIGTLADSSLRAVRIGAVRQVVVASPDYLAVRGAPAVAGDLDTHDFIASTGPRAANEWRFPERPGFRPRARLSVNTVDAALVAAKAGIGLASFLSYQVAEAIAAGQLVEVMRAQRPELMPVNLLFAAARAETASARALIEAMRKRASEGDWDCL